MEPTQGGIGTAKAAMVSMSKTFAAIGDEIEHDNGPIGHGAPHPRPGYRYGRDRFRSRCARKVSSDPTGMRFQLSTSNSV